MFESVTLSYFKNKYTIYLIYKKDYILYEYQFIVLHNVHNLLSVSSCFRMLFDNYLIYCLPNTQT